MLLCATSSVWDESKHNEECAHRVAWAGGKRDYEKDQKMSDWKAKWLNTIRD